MNPLIPGRPIIAVDFDGVLAVYPDVESNDPAPVLRMVTLVKDWISWGLQIVIFTSRVSRESHNEEHVVEQHKVLRSWIKKHIGQELLITAEKWTTFTAIIDDRGVWCARNTGKPSFARHAVFEKIYRCFPSDRELEECPVDISEAKATDFLRFSASIMDGREREFGRHTYLQFGLILHAFFPDGLTVNSVEAWNRLGALFMVIHKLARYAGPKGLAGHVDSADDLISYAAILRETTNVQ